MSMWARYPQQMANKVRQRAALIQVLEARGVQLETWKGGAYSRQKNGRIFLTMRGLRAIWERCFPGEPVPAPMERL